MYCVHHLAPRAADRTTHCSRTTSSTTRPWWARPSGEPFWEPLTGRIAGDAGEELREAAASHVRRGDWPWLFWCAEERCRKPLFPSEIRFAARRDDRVGIAVVCSACERASLNVVTPWHLDVPFFHDRAVEASDRPLRSLDSSRFAAALAAAPMRERALR